MSDTNTGQVVLITGASSGIGQAAARRLTAAGYRVFGTSRRPTAATVDGYAMLPPRCHVGRVGRDVRANGA